MHPRYEHPIIAELWSPRWTYGSWLSIETLVLAAQRELGLIPADETGPMQERLNQMIFRPDDVPAVEMNERTTRHDVAAFLRWLREPLGSVGRWLHWGLTSSDLVDTTQGRRFRSAGQLFREEALELTSELTRWSIRATPILGRTHGQVAEPMEIRARGLHWLTLVSWPAKDLLRAARRLEICKLSGPVGTFAHNPPEVEEAVAARLLLQPMGTGASQIVPRSALAAWASSAAGLVEALAKIATDIRLMNLLGEVAVPMAEGQVGSSSMAHKQNPIVAEQICGLAQMARGYALMLQPVAGWLERDIAHSSVERVAVPDLWHTVLHAVKQTTLLLRGSELDQWAIGEQYRRAGGQPLTSERTLAWIHAGMSTEEARVKALKVDTAATPVDAARFMQNYPVKAYDESQ